jgi:F-type H+-transporting ATPase subunit delta
VTPNETIVNNTPVHMVTVPAVTGVMGILADHAPTIAQLIPGVVTVHTADLNDVTHRLFISGGFAVVTNESRASITAVEAVRLEDLDLQAARQGLSDAQATLAKAGDEKEKASAQVGIEVLEGVIAALEQTK